MKNLLSWGVFSKKLKYIFNQSGDGEVITSVYDNGLLDYLLENIKIYQGKYQEDGSMLVTPLIINKNKTNYNANIVSYVNGELINDIGANSNDKRDFFTQFPTIYYKSEEIEKDKFLITFSTTPFIGAHKVFGEDNLIGYGSGMITNNNWYSNRSSFGKHCTFTECKEILKNKGEGYYGFTSDEMGVLVFLDIYANGLNGDVIKMNSFFLGISSVFSNNDSGRNYCLNISKNNTEITINHLDGTIEKLENITLTYHTPMTKLHIGEYLNIIPTAFDSGANIFDSEVCFIEPIGIGVYYSDRNKWFICADRDDSNIVDSTKLKIRPCFKGKIIETTDIDYFLSLPITN